MNKEMYITYADFIDWNKKNNIGRIEITLVSKNTISIEEYGKLIGEIDNVKNCYITNKELQQENTQLKEKINKLEILIENLKLGVVLNDEQEKLLDKVLGDSNE